MTLNLKKTLLLLLLPLSLHTEEAWARFALNGLGDLEYVTFEENNTDGKVEASQFQQKYEVGLSNGGVILDKGFGDYAFALRYLHMQSDASVDGNNSLAVNQKLLWSGNINIAPKKLPLTLRMYSNDLNPLTPATSVSIPKVRSSLAPTIMDGIDSGISRRSGLFFELDNSYGGRGNGRSNGRSNGNGGNGGNGNGGNGGNGNGGNGGNGNGGNGGNGNGGNGGNGNGGGSSWRRLPKIVLDYNNTYIDTGYAHENTDQLRLSLNEKKGWLHYDWKRYDNLEGGGGSTDEGFQVGNVNRNGGREWFYVSNWTLLSMDGTFKRSDSDGTPGTNDTYSVNLFASAFRSWWDATLYGSYSQALNDEGRISDSQLSLPLYISARPSINSLVSWKNSFRQWEKLDLDNPSTTTVDERKTRESQKEIIEDISSTHLHFTGQDLTFKPRYTFIKEWGDGIYLTSKTAHTLSLSLDSSPTKNYGYGASYTFATIKDDDSGDDTDDFTSHNLSVNGRYAITQWLGVTGSQSVTISYDSDRIPKPETRTYVTSIGTNMYLHRTLTIDLSGRRIYTENVGDSHDESRLFTGNIRYTPLYWLRIVSLNSYSEEVGSKSSGVSSLTGAFSTEERNSSFYTTDNSMEVKVNRAFSSRTRVNYSAENNRLTNLETTAFTAEEGFEYTVLAKAYRVRTLLSVTGSAIYSESRSITGIDTRSEGATLGFNHHPYRFMSWGGTGRYTEDLTNHDVTKGGSLYIAFPFPKMNLNASYTIEQKEAALDTNDYDAQKVLVKLTKAF